MTNPTEQRQENRMGTMPVNRLLLSMAVPIMISMLVQALYNVVDSIFVSRVGENALTAVSLAFHVQSLMIAISVGTGVGINALLSRSLGEKNFDEADRAANNGVFLAVMGSLVFMLFGFFFAKQFFLSQTTDPEIIGYGVQYLQICTIFSIGMFGQMTFERIMQSTGKTMYTMVTQGAGAILNIILDPILIFGLLGMPAMGVSGAAVATVIGQCVAMLLALFFNLTKNKEIKLTIKGFRPNGGTIKRIYAVGIPSIIMQSIGSVMVLGMNNILMSFSSTATAVFGVYFKLQSFVFMPVFGLNNGMVPIISYNYGARHKHRMVKTMKISVMYAVAIMLVGLLIFQAGPGMLLGMFNASEDMMGIGTIALRTISWSFLFAGFSIVISSVFQALGNGMYSLIVSVVRQLMVLLPIAWLLSKSGNVNLVWLAFPLAELIAAIVTALFMKKVNRVIIHPMAGENA